MEFASYLLSYQLQLLQVLQRSNVAISENTVAACGNDYKWDGWTFNKRDYRNVSKKRTEMVICTNTHKANYVHWASELNRTLTHEAVHVAQICKSGGGVVPLGFKKDIEDEAFALQDRPDKVIHIIKKYCL